jgi:hypothetical protein
MSNNVFVFVVCGASEHINTLHLSLKYLKRFSKNEIIIVTDTSRNEIEICHHQIIEVKVDDKYNNHQASIYLKTGLHKFLPKGNNYCYLDTDVVALSNDCDAIFDEFISPIRFAPDHCKIRKFSPYAVNCDCTIRWKKNRDLFEKYITCANNKIIKDPHLLNKASELQNLFNSLKKRSLKSIFTTVRFFISYPVFKLNDEFFFNKKSRTWHIKSGEIIIYEGDSSKLVKIPDGLFYDKINKRWLDKNGDDIWLDECNHLIDYIKQTFNIEVKDKNWQHWNGGVFLFNDDSHPFLEAWFSKNIHIFGLSKWKTRDQGTLIATAWEFGLANHPTLSKKFNFIADYNNNGVQINHATNQITDDGFATTQSPVFIHVYHHWMDKNWPIWQWIETFL